MKTRPPHQLLHLPPLLPSLQAVLHSPGPRSPVRPCRDLPSPGTRLLHDRLPHLPGHAEVALSMKALMVVRLPWQVHRVTGSLPRSQLKPMLVMSVCQGM